MSEVVCNKLNICSNISFFLLHTRRSSLFLFFSSPSNRPRNLKRANYCYFEYLKGPTICVSTFLSLSSLRKASLQKKGWCCFAFGRNPFLPQLTYLQEESLGTSLRNASFIGSPSRDLGILFSKFGCFVGDATIGDQRSLEKCFKALKFIISTHGFIYLRRFFIKFRLNHFGRRLLNATKTREW